MISYGGIWGTVSDDNFNDDDAKVACYMLGFGYIRLLESLRNAKVSARQQCVYTKAPSEEIYGKSTRGTLC